MDELRQLLLFLLTLHLSVSGIKSTTFTIVNECDFPVWPVISNIGNLSLGVVLQKGESWGMQLPSVRSACTGCSEDSAGKFSCLTGDCGSGILECGGGRVARPPATLVEFGLSAINGQDFFDVSLVDGYNLPIMVAPAGASRTNCTTTGCVVDVNAACPAELMVKSSDGAVVGCRSACSVFQSPQYCCTGNYGTPDTCRPSSYSQIFKTACPRAYSYAYDDGTSTFTCLSTDYNITFCPAPIARLELNLKLYSNYNFFPAFVLCVVPPGLTEHC